MDVEQLLEKIDELLAAEGKEPTAFDLKLAGVRAAIHNTFDDLHSENARLAAEVERLRRMAECWKFWEPGDRFYHAKDRTWWKCEDQEHLKRAEPPEGKS